MVPSKHLSWSTVEIRRVCLPTTPLSYHLGKNKEKFKKKRVNLEGLKGQVEEISKDRRYKVSVKGKSFDVILHRDLEDGGFWVECPLLSGCASQGDTVEEALAMIKDAIAGHLEMETEKEKRKPLPRSTKGIA